MKASRAPSPTSTTSGDRCQIRKSPKGGLIQTDTFTLGFIGRSEMSFVARRLAAFSTATIFLVASFGGAFAQKKYDPGVSDTEIKIGQTMPFSGPASAYATISKAEAAYFRMVNEQGGINGRKINLIAYDDGYNPA